MILAEEDTADDGHDHLDHSQPGKLPIGHAPATCYLGTIEPGQTVTIVVKLRATKVGPMPNSVAVSAATEIVDPPTVEVAGEVVAEDRPSRPKPPRELPFTGCRWS